jgi:hypothetical protein
MNGQKVETSIVASTTSTNTSVEQEISFLTRRNTMAREFRDHGQDTLWHLSKTVLMTQGVKKHSHKDNGGMLHPRMHLVPIWTCNCLKDSDTGNVAHACCMMGRYLHS